MEFRSFNFETRSIDDEGKFEGYGSVFGSLAEGYNTIMDGGCFLRSIKHNKGFFPLLWFHNPTIPVGSFIGEEDGKGLLTHGDVDLDIEPGQRMYSGMKKKYIDRMSIGFDRVEEIAAEKSKDGHTHITQAKLWEVSLITRNFAADEQALIGDVRAANVGLQRVTQALRDGATLELQNALVDLRNLLEMPGLTVPPTEGRPYPTEHSCRLVDPKKFKEDSFRRTSRKSDGKTYHIISGRLKGKTTMTEQGYRYPKDTWSASQAKKHCNDHDGIRFEPAVQSDSIRDTMREIKALFTEENSALTTSHGENPPASDNDPQSHSLLDELRAFATTLHN